LEERSFTADRGDAGGRLDLVVVRHMHDVSGATRSAVQRWIEGGLVTVNGRRVYRPAAKTATGDILGISLPPQYSRRRRPLAQDLPVDILYEDDHLLAVNKPAGLVAHPSYKHPNGTLMNALLWRARTWRPDERPSLVGRLDKLTSGVVMVARTTAIHAALQRELTSKRAAKDYLALSYGIAPHQGVIDLKLSRDVNDRRRVVASSSAGVRSVTEFERLSTCEAAPIGLSLLRCRLVTGRTHQIRVHLAASGWPVVGDPNYGDDRWKHVADGALAGRLSALARQALHAWRVGFNHPVTRERLIFEAPVPEDLRRLPLFEICSSA
jgi:23S rRNA pseudouridine1911/1915/1917 synthase